MRKEVFRMDNVTYSAGGIRFVDMFRLHIFEGQIMGLFFSDNHGEDEFVDVITENLPIEYGNLFIAGRCTNTYLEARPGHNPDVALISRTGALILEMSVADNIFVLRGNFRKYVINNAVLSAQFDRIAAEYGIDISGSMPAGDLPTADRYLLELLKTVVTQESLIIIRNITDVLQGTSLDRFNALVKRLSGMGRSFLYIDDNYEELFRVCDLIAVAEKGQVMNIFDRAHFGIDFFRKYAFDTENTGKRSEDLADSVLRFNTVSYGAIRLMDFAVAEGECVLLRCRRDAVISAIVDLITRRAVPEAGYILFEHRRLHSPHGENSISVIHELPTRTMVFPDMSYLDNLCFHAAERTPSLWRRNAHKSSVRGEYRQRIGEDIDAISLEGVSLTSLYNLVYARELLFRPHLAVLVKPFMDTGIELKQHILTLIYSLRAAGTTVLILDNNTAESTLIADRILTLTKDGQIDAISREDIREDERHVKSHHA
jgi:ribose transport system ATP-binding protein